MAIKQIKIGNTSYDLNDKRISAIDSTVQSGSSNPVTGGAVYSALQNAGGGGGVTELLFNVKFSNGWPCDVKHVNERDNTSEWNSFKNYVGYADSSTFGAAYLDEIFNALNTHARYKIYFDGLYVYSASIANVVTADTDPIVAHQIFVAHSDDIQQLFYNGDEISYVVFEDNSHRFILGRFWDDQGEAYEYFAIKSLKQNILFVDPSWSMNGVFAFNNWVSGAKKNFNDGILQAVRGGKFDAVYDMNAEVLLPLKSYRNTDNEIIYGAEEKIGGADMEYLIMYDDINSMQFQYRSASAGGSEDVTCVVRGCEDNSRVSTSGGTVYVDRYNPATGETAQDTYSIPSSGIVTFNVPKGWHYSVYSKVSGLGASFRMTYSASEDTRFVPLWNCSIGVFHFSYAAICGDDGGSYRCTPVIYDDKQAQDNGDYQEWDVGDGVSADYGYYNSENVGGDDHYEDGEPMGILVSIADCSFLIAPNYKASETMYWSKQNYGKNVPGLEQFYITNGYDWSAAINAGRSDYNGALNTDKIVSALIDAPAADWAVKATQYYRNAYLPSTGELYQMYLNKASINTCLNAEGNSQSYPQLDISWYWSSSAYNPDDSLGVSMYSGHVDYRNKYGSNDVLAVSVFTFYY